MRGARLPPRSGGCFSQPLFVCPNTGSLATAKNANFLTALPQRSWDLSGIAVCQRLMMTGELARFCVPSTFDGGNRSAYNPQVRIPLTLPGEPVDDAIMATLHSQNRPGGLGDRRRRQGHRALLLHPFLLALYPVLALLAENAREMPLSDAYRSIGVALAGATVLLLILRLALHSWQLAGALTSLLVVLFFSYGHVYSLVKMAQVGDLLIGRHRFLLPTWLTFLALGSWALAALIRDLVRFTQLLNLVAVLALAAPVYTLSEFVVRSNIGASTLANGPLEQTDELQGEMGAWLPDVYYIVFDAYGRTDILQEQYEYDNTAFEDFLRDRGFYVAEQSTSNYMWTGLSLTSSLNMDFIQNLLHDVRRGDYPSALSRPIKRSVVRRRLEGLGYSTISVPSGYSLTELYDATHFLTPDMARMENLRLRGAFNAFEGLLLHTSAGRILVDFDSLLSLPLTDFIEKRLEYPSRIQREYVLSAFENLKTIPQIGGPKFVFVHIVSPHEPYFFGPNGEDILQGQPFTLALWEAMPPDERALRYRDQLIYISSRIEETVDAILSRSERPPIIILQSDHGPRHISLSFDDPSPEALRSRMAILNAYHLPDGCDRHLYETITPVNTFRIVFNCYFGGSFALLEDVTYFSDLDGTRPWDFVRVDELLE